MGHHHSNEKRLMIPVTIEELQLNEGRRISLSSASIHELDHFIENNKGRLEKGKKFSSSCTNITAEFYGADIRLCCVAKRPDGSEVEAEIMLGML